MSTWDRPFIETGETERKTIGSISDTKQKSVRPSSRGTCSSGVELGRVLSSQNKLGSLDRLRLWKGAGGGGGGGGGRRSLQEKMEI